MKNDPIRTSPFDLARAKAGAPLYYKRGEQLEPCSYVGTTRSGEIVIEHRSGGVLVYQANGEYVPGGRHLVMAAPETHQERSSVNATVAPCSARTLKPDHEFPHIVEVDAEYLWCRGCNSTCGITADPIGFLQKHGDGCRSKAQNQPSPIHATADLTRREAAEAWAVEYQGNRRDTCFAIGEKMLELGGTEAVVAWRSLGQAMLRLGEKDVPRFLDLLADINAATMIGATFPGKQKGGAS